MNFFKKISQLNSKIKFFKIFQLKLLSSNGEIKNILFSVKDDAEAATVNCLIKDVK